ncbi:hypothetical protein MCOR29_010289 [Pyricularia oryzae]|nr:hypothetical protein MCOR29_010289 [Pyricularia oryzae]KAI6333842.1 hypothetical protein MCOR30_004125 [Pyricularia oryzae]KAI6401897.1 hypothetical protein MCOR24_008416 [Pyricularia oryzae]KAI6462262.1 hypothetical protein MCOR15_004726 [Pyricularia oryzae]KAI6538219.1 hypothetical protein MCOR16_001791 [Pyricularia oryzae]
MYFNKISQLLSLAALSGTALGYPLAGNSISGLAARDIDSGAQILSPRQDPPKPKEVNPYPWGAWMPDRSGGADNTDNGGSNAGRRTGRGRIRARSAATDGGAQTLSPRRDPSKPPSDAPSHPFGTWFPEPPAVSVNNGNGGSNVGTGTGRGNIRAR